MSGFILLGIDRIYLASLMSMEKVGIYSMAGNLGMIMALLTSAVVMAYAPFFLKQAIQFP